MRSIPSSVVVITASTSRSKAFEDGETEKAPPPDHKYYRGMTLSSFNTLSLKDVPLVTFNIQTPSSTLLAIENTRQFFVHILQANEQGAAIADAFTKGNRSGNKLFVGNEWDVEGVRLKSMTQSPVDIVIPKLVGSGVGVVLRCSTNFDDDKKSRLIGIGDHKIVIGMVHEIMGDVTMGSEGLGYAYGKYRALGRSIHERPLSIRRMVGGRPTVTSN